MPKFDVAIGNPPYEGKGNPLYLQILDKVLNIANETVWLCPSQWVKNYKDTKFLKEFKSKHKLTSHKNIGNPFADASLANEVGVFVFNDSKSKEDYEDIRLEKFQNPVLAKSIWNKFENYKDNLYNHVNKEDYKKFYVSCAAVRGHTHNGKPCWDWTTLFGPKQHTDFSKPKSTQAFFKFDSEDECKNFIKSTETDIFMFSIFIGKLNINIDLNKFDIMPWFGDYTREWSEKDIQKELGITDEELDYIHDEMKDFGWKTRNK